MKGHGGRVKIANDVRQARVDANRVLIAQPRNSVQPDLKAQVPAKALSGHTLTGLRMGPDAEEMSRFKNKWSRQQCRSIFCPRNVLSRR